MTLPVTCPCCHNCTRGRVTGRRWTNATCRCCRRAFSYRSWRSGGNGGATFYDVEARRA